MEADIAMETRDMAEGGAHHPPASEMMQRGKSAAQSAR